MKYFLLILMLGCLSGCKNNSDFLYYVKDQSISSNYKIKDLVGSNKLDMLWVIDNSGSMTTYQTSVAANTAVFINSLATGGKSLDWKIGLISTDIINPPFIGMIPGSELTSTTPDFVNKFIGAVQYLGTSGDGVERSYEPIISSLQRYPNFLRPDATLAIIVVSDAPEQSNLSTTKFVASLKTIKGSLTNILFYGILSPTEWCSSTDDSWTWAGSKFEELSTFIKGKSYPICDANFAKNLVSIGSDIARQISNSKIYLKSKPQVKTLSVTYQGQTLPGGDKASGGYWVYDTDINAIVFNDLNFAPNGMEEVNVYYLEDKGAE